MNIAAPTRAVKVTAGGLKSAPRRAEDEGKGRTVRTVNYEDEIYLLTLVLQELDYGAKLDVQSTRFLDRFQADLAFLDEALGDYHASLCGNSQLPNRLSYLRVLHRVQVGFSTLVGDLVRGSNPLGRAFAPLGETLRAMARKHAELARAVASVLGDSGDGKPSDQHVISEEEFRILLADEGTAE